MLLVELTINSVVNYISNEDIKDLTHMWDAKIISFQSPQLKCDSIYGGFCRVGFGSLELVPDLFENDWPPPITCPITVKYTATTEAAAETIFSGTAHLTGISRGYVTYELFGPQYSAELLTETTDYNGDTVALPRAFGAVAHVRPVRVADVGGDPTYHNGYLSGTKGTDWHIYDDQTNIDANVTDNGNDTFSVNPAPTGEVTISGTGEDTTLSEIMSWACGASYLNLTYDGTAARSPSPDLGCWADAQTLVVDFLSEIAAYLTHLFYVAGSTLYLADMLADNGSETITEFDYFPSDYPYNEPVGLFKSSVTVRTIVGDRIADIEKTAQQASSYPYGDETQITAYQTSVGDIETALADINTVHHALRGELRMPFVGGLPNPGEKLSWPDTSLVVDSDIYIRARDISYDFDSEEVVVVGEGAISAS